MSSTGTVVRFDRKRGYGFIQPDDGGEDVFVHQNNISMEGFRYLMVGEKVQYELEVGEKGMKATQVSLTEPRKERPRDDFGNEGGDFGGDFGGGRDDRDLGRPRRESRPPRFGGNGGNGGGNGDSLGAKFDRFARKQEKLISLLVEKGLIQPGDLDAPAGEPAAISDAGKA